MSNSLSFSRRQFLRTAAIAGAAPFILPGRIWSADTPPNSVINVGFIGLGKQGAGLLKGTLGRTELRVIALCDVDATRRGLAKKQVAEAYAKDGGGTAPGCDEYSDFKELLARKDIDAVVIATPDHWHALIAIAAARAGKDIYCEKPMAHTILEGRAMVKAVRENNRIFQVGSMQRSMGEFRAACELVRNGVIGTVTKVDAAVGGPPIMCDLPEEPAEPGLNWDRWLGPAPARPYNSILSPRGMPKGYPAWRHYREYGGGGVCDWGAHHFDIVQWAFGYDQGGPVKFIPGATDKEGFGVHWQYDNGVEVTHRKGNGITFYGSQGKIFVNRGKFEFYLGDTLKSGPMDDYSRLLKQYLPANAVRLYRSTNQIANWVASMKSRALPVCDVETGQRSATVCNLVNLVYFHGQEIQWNPATEQFAGATGDPAWLTREYRAPWQLS